jgi:hypothetical protein
MVSLGILHDRVKLILRLLSNNDPSNREIPQSGSRNEFLGVMITILFMYSYGVVLESRLYMLTGLLFAKF